MHGNDVFLQVKKVEVEIFDFNFDFDEIVACEYKPFLFGFVINSPSANINFLRHSLIRVD